MPCYVYVDGAYLRAELRRVNKSDEFNPCKPAAVVRNQRIAGHQLEASRVFYYDALDPQADQTEQDRQRDYFKRLQRLPDTHVVLGEVRRGLKGGRREQKGVDVQMAIDALRAATSSVVQAIALVTGDADFAPLATAVREVGPHVIVVAFADSLADSLRREADRVHLFASPPEDWHDFRE
ncbi:MAG TPA: NYN domain-containing protein [Dehalococcoidia bacterium]|nr:NYN domain-containing protein [Dehalococcoidia bacterium]